MTNLQRALGGMARVQQFFPWRLTPNAASGKYDKVPCTLDGLRWPINAADPLNWTTHERAAAAVAHLDAQRGVVRYALGFYLTPGCGYFLLDLDYAMGEDGQWLPFAQQLCAAFPGAMVELSSSGRGLHVIGRAAPPVGHRSKPPADVAGRIEPLELELYSQDRGICFGLDDHAQGSVDTVVDLAPLCAAYFPPRAERDVAEGARAEWRGPVDDDVLVERMLGARLSAAAAFGGKPSLPQLWRGECAKDSESDMALASHLAFWTGCDEERIARLMMRSGLVRDKWHTRRPDGTYLTMTIANACASCDNVYQEPAAKIAAAGGENAAGATSATSDLSNAYRLQAAHGDSLMHVDGLGWHVWVGGGPWRHDDHAASRLAFGLGKAVQAEADAMDAWVQEATTGGMGSDEIKRRAEAHKHRKRWAKQSESKAVIDHSLSLAESLLAVSADTLDASPLLVGCPGGVLDLATRTMREHRREDRISKTIACDHSPAAQAPQWDRFISEIFGGNAELLTYVPTLAGYFLSGQRGEHLLPVFHGSGANGKSTFLGTLQQLLGDYAGTAAPGLLISRGGNDHPTGLAALQGKRLVVCSETAETGKLDEEQVKKLTGGDLISARRMRQDFFTFRPTHIIALQTNFRPKVLGTDTGIWRRIKLIPFSVTIPAERRDPQLSEKLAAELPGILSWAVAGWQMYQQRGFVEPRDVEEATAEYRSSSDHVGNFLDDRCTLNPELTVPTATLYFNYRNWCTEAGEHPLTQRALALRLSERPGVTSGRTKHARLWHGLGIDSHALLAAFPISGQ